MPLILAKQYKSRAKTLNLTTINLYLKEISISQELNGEQLISYTSGKQKTDRLVSLNIGGSIVSDQQLIAEELNTFFSNISIYLDSAISVCVKTKNKPITEFLRSFL